MQPDVLLRLRLRTPLAVSVVTVSRNFERQQRWTTLLLAPVQLGATV